MTCRTRIAVQLHPQQASYGQLRDAVARAEDIGIDIAFNWDHFLPLYGDPGGSNFECWTTLAAWAEQTGRIGIGPMVSCTAYRNPNLLAEMARTVDEICDGRLILGLGAGWFERDFTEFGYEYKCSADRIADLGRSLDVISSRLNKPPGPSRVSPPVMIGGSGPRKTLPLVAKYADIWHSFLTEDELVSRRLLLDRYCRDIGRDPGSIEIAVAVGGGDRNWRMPGAAYRWGEALRAAGATLFTLAVGGPEYDLTEVADWLRWRDEVNH